MLSNAHEVYFYIKKQCSFILSIQRIKSRRNITRIYYKNSDKVKTLKVRAQVKTWFRWYKNGETHRFRNGWESNIPY